MIDKEKRTSVLYEEKYCFQKYFYRITYAREAAPYTDLEKNLRDILSDAMHNESVSIQSFIALVVHAYEK